MDVKILFRTIIAMAILSLGTAVSMAQTSTGEVTGTISDQQGAFVAQARVILTNSATGVKRETVTNDAGRFNFTAVSTSGTYTVAVEAQGFRNLVQGEISVQVNQIVALDYKLTVGNVEEKVEVAGGSGDAGDGQLEPRNGNRYQGGE